MKRTALVVALGLAAWEGYARTGAVDAFILPAPSEVARALWQDRALLAHNLAVTGGEVLLGVALALVAGLAFAAGLHLVPWLRGAVYPLLVASQTVPVVIVAPLLVAWFGYDLTPKLLIIALVCFFPVVVATLDGLARVDADLLKLMRSLDASRLETFRRVELPSALPALASGAKVAVAVAVIGAVLAEQAGSSDGLGHLLLQAIPQLETARAYAAVVLLSALALVLFYGLALLERYALPWTTPRARAGGRP